MEFDDPIATMKNDFLKIQLRLIEMSVILTIIVVIFTRNKIKFIRNLTIITLLSLIMIIIQTGIKLYLDSKYDEEEFEQLYEMYKEDDDKYYKDISIGLSGVNVIGAKESYVKKSINAYNVFKIKTTMFIVIHLLTVILTIYIINKIIISETKKTRLSHDEIFYGK